MEILAICGSPRGKRSQTRRLTEKVLEAAQTEGAQVSLEDLSTVRVEFCQACELCHKEPRCKHSDEGMRIINKILTVDGLVFKVDVKDLVAEKPAALAFPKAARDPQVSEGHAFSSKATEDDSTVSSFRKLADKWDTCRIVASAPIKKELEDLKAQPESDAREKKIKAAEAKIDPAVARMCNTAAMEKAKKDGWAKLAKSRTSRRDQSRAANQKRADQLFPK